MLLWVMLWAGCGGGDDVADELDDRVVSMPAPEMGYQVSTPPYVVEPFSEVQICSVVRLEPHADETLMWTNRLESLISDGSHHMNVLMGEFSVMDAFLGDGAAANVLGADVGQYPCDELAAMESAFPFFPSQRTNQEITFPKGVAAPLVAPALIIFDHHYVNTSDRAVQINAVLNIETMPPEEIEHVAGLVFDAIGEVSVPPGASRTHHRTCVMDRDVEVALVSTHNHEWGECATLHDYDGEQVADDPFYVNRLWESPPILHFEEGSFPIRAGEGVHYACHYRNDTDRELVDDGTADGEMCVFAAVVYPTSLTVEQVETTVETRDLVSLTTLLDETLGGCDDSVVTPGPWSDATRPIDDPDPCEGLEQTEGNVLDP